MRSTSSHSTGDTTGNFQNDDYGKNVNRRNSATGSTATFSLAYRNPRHQRDYYIDPRYREMNPQYGKMSDNEPLWSLAQPLPHVVRPGMFRGVLPEDRKEDDKQPQAGTSERVTEQEAVDAQHGPSQLGVEPETAAADERGFFNTWCKIRFYLREPLGEWLGSTLAILLGLGASLSWQTSQNQAGTFATQSTTWGFAFMLGIYIVGGVSGGHLNPVITISLSVWRGFPARRCLSYVLAQVIGAITGAGLAYAIYYDAIAHLAVQNQVPIESSAAAQSLITGPKEYVSYVTGFFSEFLGSAILVGTILALGDDSNAPSASGMQAFIIGILIVILCLAFAYNTGGCFNSARDFGPRLVVLMAGWGPHVFHEKYAWWVWGPWIADPLGGLFGALIYDLVVFTGGESPVNYPPRRRKRALTVKKMNLRRYLRWGAQKARDSERAGGLAE